MSEARKRMNFTQIAGMLFLLVILPAGSWYYLQRGFLHRKEALAELTDHGTVRAFRLRDQYGNSFSSEWLHKRVTIAAFLPNDTAQQQQWASRLHGLHQQFDDRNDVCFLLFADSSQMRDPMGFAIENDLVDSLQWEILTCSRPELESFAFESFYVPDLQQIALVDTGLVVRRYYDILDNQQMGRLIEHITIVMPRLPDPDIVFRRDKEK
ncbi:MAG: hypothetical protein IPL49_05960 [Saprospirales bacterium]|nr:hypothetical protein [Saprospirales bacterium]